MIKISVIGTGYMGFNHVRIFSQTEDCEVVGICDSDEEKGKKVAKRFHCKFYSDYKEMYETEKPDGVSICVPTSAHKEVATYFIENGVPCLLEKPVAATVEEAEGINDAAKKSGSLVLVGHIERFNPAIRYLKRMIENGELGEIFLVDAERVAPLPVRIQDVGAVIDLAVHDIDIFHFVIGKKVTCVYSLVRGISRKDVEDFGEAIFTFEGGATGHLRVNWLTPTKIRKLKVFGKKGMAEVDYISQELYFYENVPMKEELDYGRMLFSVMEGEMRRPKINKEEPLKAELMHFLRCVEGKEKQVISLEEGIEALRIAEAMKNSSNNGKVEKVG
ncbi:MAG: Gfo/Idh/MocA family oxidoreductase [Candidatus Micrarchaeota archaeon]